MLRWRGASASAFALLLVFAVGCQPRGGPASGSPSAGDPVPEVRYAAARGLQHYNRDTRYERTDLAQLERGLIQDSALSTFWMGGPTKYAAYF